MTGKFEHESTLTVANTDTARAKLYFRATLVLWASCSFAITSL